MKIEEKMPGLFANLVEPSLENELGEQVSKEFKNCEKFSESQLE